MTQQLADFPRQQCSCKIRTHCIIIENLVAQTPVLGTVPQITQFAYPILGVQKCYCKIQPEHLSQDLLNLLILLQCNGKKTKLGLILLWELNNFYIKNRPQKLSKEIMN